MPIELDIEGHVAIVTINESKTRNALTQQTAEQFVEHLDTAVSCADVGVLVVRGAGGTFCSGADRDIIARGRADINAPGVARAFQTIYHVFDVIANLPIPTIAAIRGAAVGAGVNLALAADVRVVAEDAKVRPGFVRLGLHPGGGHFLLSQRVAGEQSTVAMSILGADVDGRRLAELGIAWVAVPDAEVDSTALTLAAGVTDPELVRRATATMRAEAVDAPLSLQAAARLEQQHQFWSLTRSSG